MLFAATWIDLKVVILIKVNQTEKKIYHMITLICEIPLLKLIRMNFFTKQKQSYCYQKQIYDYQS